MSMCLGVGLLMQHWKDGWTTKVTGEGSLKGRNGEARSVTLARFSVLSPSNLRHGDRDGPRLSLRQPRHVVRRGIRIRTSVNRGLPILSQVGGRVCSAT